MNCLGCPLPRYRDDVEPRKKGHIDMDRMRMQDLRGKSLLIFSTNNPFRRFVASIVLNPFFDLLMLGVIIFSSVALSLDYPKLHPQSALKQVLGKLDILFAALFGAEFALKIITLGTVRCPCCWLLEPPRLSMYRNSVPGARAGVAFHEGAYFRSGWNWLDFTIVVIGFVLLGLGNQKNLKFLRGLRTFRALRPLRMISWNPGMRVVVNAIFQAIPALGDVLVVCLIVYFIFVSGGLHWTDRCCASGWTAWIPTISSSCRVFWASTCLPASWTSASIHVSRSRAALARDFSISASPFPLLP